MIIMVIVKFFLVTNIMIFISALILHKWGMNMIIDRKIPIFISIIFNFLVPKQALYHYSAIKLYFIIINN